MEQIMSEMVAHSPCHHRGDQGNCTNLLRSCNDTHIDQASSRVSVSGKESAGAEWEWSLRPGGAANVRSPFHR